MRTVPYSQVDLAEQMAEFAAKITPVKERWGYCFDRASYAHPTDRIGYTWSLNLRTLPVCAKILGVPVTSVGGRLGDIGRLGLDEAFEWDESNPTRLGRARFRVGPFQAWHVGHLYFARVVSHPHVVKVGFSRRVHERFDDIASKCKAKVMMVSGELRAGTLADEHWWHKNWCNHRISGEWFFDPHTTERSLPDFLARTNEAEAA